MNKLVKHPGNFRLAACQLISAGIISAACQNARAQLLFSEPFNYTPGVGIAGQGGWTGGNASEMQIGSSQLTYAGLQEATGNELVYTSSGSSSSTYNTYSAVTSGSIYYSFLIDCTSLPTANEYVTSLNPGTTTPGGSSDAMATYVGTPSAGMWKIGVRNGNSGAAYSGALSPNTTYFVVEELTLGSAPTLNLFVDPVPGSTQASFGTPNATQTGTVAVSSVDDVGFKVQSTTATGNFDIGNLLIAPDWADVTPATVVPEPSTYALFGLGSLVAAWKLRRRQASI